MLSSEEIEIGITRCDLPINEMNSIKNAKRSKVIRLTRTGKGSTSGDRQKLSTKQMIIADRFYEKARALANY
jgi:hypothetical protein